MKVTERHLTSGEVHQEITRSLNGGTLISAAAAVTIASWWHSPGRIGHTLASFASGLDVTRDDLLADIEATITEAPGRVDNAELLALRDWAEHQPDDGARERQYPEDYCLHNHGAFGLCTLWPDHRGPHQDANGGSWPR